MLGEQFKAIYMLKSIREHIFVIAFFLLMTLVLTYPLVSHFSTHLAGDSGDGWQNVWNMWWMNKALMGLHQNPYYTNYLFYPNGTTLIFHTFNPFNALVSVPLQRIFNLITTYNIIFIFSFVFSGFGMYLLSKYLIRNKFVSIIVGYIFTFCPYHMAHGLGHLQLISMEFIPFFILYLLKTFSENNKVNIFLAGIFLVLVALCDWYYLFFCFIFTILYILYEMIIKKHITSFTIKKALLIFVIASIFLAPFLIAAIKAFSTYRFIGAHDPEEWSADLLSFFIPSTIQTLSHLSNSLREIFSSFPGNTSENSNYIGYALLILAIYSFVHLQRDNLTMRFLFFSACVFFVLTLGMHLHVGGRIFNIPLPYNILYKTIFFFRFTGVPERFDIMLMLCLSLLAGFGLKKILNVENKLLRITIMIIIISLIFIEYLCIPFPCTSFKVPQFYKTISHDLDDYAIIQISSLYDSRFLYYQTIHQKKMFGGYVSRISEASLKYLESTPVVSHIIYDRYPIKNNGIKLTEQEARALIGHMFKELKIKYIILPSDRINHFVRGYKFKKIYQDDIIEVYEPPK